jgi:hypothetical protein
VQKLKDQAAGASDLARRLARDEKFRKRLTSAIEHSAEARRRALSRVAGTAGDKAVQTELRRARNDLERAYRRLRAKRRTHRLRNVLVVAGLAALAAVPQVRRRIAALVAREPSLEELTREELYARAQEADISGRSEMTKQQLADALRAKS